MLLGEPCAAPLGMTIQDLVPPSPWFCSMHQGVSMYCGCNLKEGFCHMVNGMMTAKSEGSGGPLLCV